MNKSVMAILLAGTVTLGACTTYGEPDPAVSGGLTGAAIGGAAGAVGGAVIPGVSPVEGAVAGAVVGGIAGAIVADRDNDGTPDGYYQNGTYYPYQAPPPPPPPVRGSGERGR